MAFNFPDTAGQAIDGSFTHTAGGILYSWDGTTWIATSSYAETSTLDQVLARGNTTTSDIDTTGKIFYSNAFALLTDLQAVNASTYHGMFAHVHGTGKGYFSHDNVTSIAVTVGVDTVAGQSTGVFYFNGVEKPGSFIIRRGVTYTFDQSDSSNATYANVNHPLMISATLDGELNGGSHYTTGVTYKLDGVVKTMAEYVSGFVAATTRTVEWTPAASAPDTLYYWCHYHTGQGNSFSVGDGSWVELLDTNSSLADLAGVDLSTPPATGQALKFDGSNWSPGTVSVTSALADLTDTDIDTLGQTATPLTDGDYLFYNSTTSKWQNAPFTISTLNYAYFGNTVQIEGNQAGTALLLSSGSHPVAIADNNFSTGTEGQVLTAVGNDGGGNATGVVWSTASGLVARSTAQGTTASIPDNTADYITISVAKTYSLLKIEVDGSAWVTVYTDAASRTADVNRNENTDPTPGSGVIAEVITAGALTQKITPGAIGWNDDTTPSSDAYLKVVNKSGSTRATTVTLTYVKLEA